MPKTMLHAALQTANPRTDMPTERARTRGRDPSWWRSILLMLSAVFVTLSAFTGAARAGDSPTVALHVEGKSSAAAHTALTARLPKSSRVLEGADVDNALRRSGMRLPVGLAITEGRSRTQLAKPARKAADKLKADLVVIARAQTNDKAFTLIVDGKDGHVVFEGPLDLGDKDAKGLVVALAPYGDSDAPAADAPAPKADATTAPSDAEGKDANKSEPAAATDASGQDAAGSSARAPHEVATELFEVGLGFEFAGRRFSYSDPLPNSPNLRPSSNIGMAMLAIDGALYPLAGSGIKVARDIGIAFDFAHAFGVKSQTTSGDITVSNSYDRWHLGLRGRIRTGDVTAPVVGITLGIGGTSFTTENPPPKLEGGVPDVSFKFFRGGLDLRIPMSRAFLAFGLGYMHPFGTDQVYSRFRSASVNGIDARVGFGVRVVPGLEARLMADYDRYFSSFSPQVGDSYVAGGSLDQYLGLTLGLAYVF